jgi:hypothetical protein
MHYYAKEVIQEWLISAWRFNQKHSYDNKLFIFDWKINCCDPNYGIRLEYPILSKLRPDGTKMVLGTDTVWTEYPDFERLTEGIKVEAVLDVALIEDKRVKYGIEVVHKHVCSKRKRLFLKEECKDMEVYEISAEWVLGQVRRPVPPKRWPCVKI